MLTAISAFFTGSLQVILTFLGLEQRSIQGRRDNNTTASVDSRAQLVEGGWLPRGLSIMSILKKKRCPVLIGSGILLMTQCQTTNSDLSDAVLPPYKLETYNSASYTEHEAQKEVESFRPDQQRPHTPFDLEPWTERPEVHFWIQHFSGPGRPAFERQLQRGEELRPIIESILSDKGLPTDLYYLALIESGFRPEARSHKAAVGVWQFMAGTGQRYGLRRNAYLDERRDPVRATIAASAYLSDLYRAFQSWFLALSAYSTGEGRVLTAVMKHETRNFWKLSEKKAFSAETREYIPKFIAAAWVARNAERYGVRLPTAEAWPELHGVTVPSGVSLDTVGELIAMTSQSIRRYNPHLLQGMVPPGTSSYSLWLPREKVSHQAELALLRVRSRGTPDSGLYLDDDQYRVRAGDNLSAIAGMFGVTVAALRRFNELPSDRLLLGQVLRIPLGKTAKVRSVKSAKTARKMVGSANSGKRNHYVVRPGDSLSVIASAHGLSVREVRELNRLRGNFIRPGQRLTLFQSSSSSGSRAVTDELSGSRIYKVRRGDTLNRIATKFGLHPGELKKINHLRSSLILPGQILKV
ncbi:MAG: LysM peptidoglycan-binding domain-containing protein [Deltaproteobacteria bacterium]|nr:LysM peptidoglycan-binding domain-containing protein [Deltaproteobacteria bacterium]